MGERPKRRGPFAWLAWIAFGQLAEGSGDANFVPGNGGRGGSGGQVPPHVPYDEYWDERHRRANRRSRRRRS